MAGLHVVKNERQLERIVRGFSNHRRIQILRLLEVRADQALMAISGQLRINLKTASEHVRRLHLAELVIKRNRGREVLHALSPRGRKILMFLRTLE